MITYTNGDVTEPVGDGNKILVHIANSIGKWGRGVVLAISNKWKEPEIEYRKWYALRKGFELGAVQFVQVEPDLWVANLIGQKGIRTTTSGPPIRYDAVAAGLQVVAKKAKELNASIVMPRIGAGLGQGDWSVIEKIIEEELDGLSVTVYDF